jgi:hypothetical protein
MAEPVPQPGKLEWKWVAITFVMYVVFYLLPILFGFGFFAGHFGGHGTGVFLGVWTFAGIIVIAALCGYLSKGVTIWEPALAGLALTTIALLYLAYKILFASAGHRMPLFHLVVPALALLGTVFVLSLLGAWLGELAQRLWRPDPPDEG